MSPRPSTLLGLVLCLVQTIHMQEGALLNPSLRAEPGPVVPRGRPVTLVCQGPAGATICILVKDGRTMHHYQMWEPQDGSQGTEARFLIHSVSEDTAGSYHCFCVTRFGLSERSEHLHLQVTEHTSTPPSATRPAVTLPPTELTPLPTETASQTGPASRDYRMENSILLGLAGVVLLILVAILVDAGLSQRRSLQGPQE